MDGLAKMKGEKIVEQRQISHLKTRLKLWRAWLKCTAKKLLKQRLDLAFENKIESMDSLAKMHGQKIVETMVRFFI